MSAKRRRLDEDYVLTFEDGTTVVNAKGRSATFHGQPGQDTFTLGEVSLIVARVLDDLPTKRTVHTFVRDAQGRVTGAVTEEVDT